MAIKQRDFPMPKKKKLDYNPIPLQELLRRLLSESQESYRTASVAAGLSPNTVSNYMNGIRPSRDASIALADHFGINPNEMLMTAGYEPLSFFEPPLTELKVSPEVKELAAIAERIKDPDIRKHLIKMTRALYEAYVEAQGRSTESERKAKKKEVK